MARIFDPVVISANDLFDGRVIYLSPADQWVGSLCQAELITDEARAKDRLADALALSDRAVGVFLAPARPGPDGRPEPGHLRETFRAAGPSNYFHGKQAEHA